ncbi:MAG: hypothetical protein M0P31_15450 [Solirubrobacteraceae bacterium]|nr:hypothetical protein [Solirubrobacteraceae bacterium]
MSIADFVPEFWAARFRRHLDARLVYAQPTIINRDYQGEIAGMGDTVHVQKVGTPTVKTYIKNTDIAAPERPDGGTVPLTIDTMRYFNVAIDDVDRVQTQPGLFDEWTRRAGRAMGVVIDESVATVMIAGAGISGGDLGTSAAPITVGNGVGDDFTLYELAVEFRRRLDNNDAPDEDRWFVVPPDLEATARLDPQFIAAGSEEMRTGIIGRVAGFDVLKTTAVPTVTKTGGATYDSHAVLFGAGNHATTHADQIVQIKAYEIEKQFGDGVKGLNVWGTDVIESETLGCALVDKGA